MFGGNQNKQTKPEQKQKTKQPLTNIFVATYL